MTPAEMQAEVDRLTAELAYARQAQDGLESAIRIIEERRRHLVNKIAFG